MILGIDLGNCVTKTSQMICFESKCSKVPGIFNNMPVQVNSQNYYLEEGNYDTEYRKCKKIYSKALLMHAVQRSTLDIHNKVVVGLPIGQYNQDKDEYKALLMDGTRQYVDDISVYPEGVGSVIGTDYEGIIVDIGGRTTDSCQVIGDRAKKVHNPLSLPKGTLNLYADFIKALNTKYVLDLDINDAERILQTGLQIYGEPTDIQFAIEGFKEFVQSLVDLLILEYKVSTLPVLLVGGGAQLLYGPIKKRIPNARLIDNCIFANAIGFRKVGCILWQ